jgi:uncharacterized membrane protein
MRRRTLGVMVIAALALLALVTTQTAAQVKQGKSRPLTTHTLMGVIVGPQCGALNNALKDSGPADDAGWKKAAQQAELLNEASHILMADGRCPDAKWAEACKTLDDCSKVILEKVKAKDAAGARQAFAAMTQACAGCHAAHKK